MATCRSVINTALRKIGVLAAGREARPTDATDALASLQSLYLGLIDGGAFGRLADVVPLGTHYTSSGNERIFRNSDATMTIGLPEVVSDASGSATYGTTITISTDGDTTTVDVKPAQPIGYVKPPRDCSPVVIADAFTASTTTYLYDGGIKAWQTIDGLTLDGVAPLAARNPDGMASLLAAQIADQFGGDLPALTARSAAMFQSGLSTRFSAPREEATGVYM